MTKTGIKIVTLMLSMICLCACTKQESIDAFEFCKRYNHEYGKEKIAYESFFKEDKQQCCYYSFVDIYDKTALLSINIDENATVTGIALTVTNDTTSFTENELNEFYNTFIRLTSILNEEEYENTEAEIIECGILPDDIEFNDKNFETINDKAKFTVIENSEIITLYSEKI